jgi:ubiquinone/menaquinone biosynthesis C-methylase UbiE
MGYESEVSRHYLKEAVDLGLDELSTMPDEVVRNREISTILDVLSLLDNKELRILEVGCGNGTLLSRLHADGYSNVYALDYLPEFVDLAKSRALPYNIQVGDVRALDYESNYFDVVISERVIINLLDLEDQAKAFRELHRVLKKNGIAILFEAFSDSLENLNKSRREFGLESLLQPSFNRWFSPDEFDYCIKDIFKKEVIINNVELEKSNMFSTHYYMSRVMHPVLLSFSPDKNLPQRNSSFVNFFSNTLPNYGSFGCVQFWCLRAI